MEFFEYVDLSAGERMSLVQDGSPTMIHCSPRISSSAKVAKWPRGTRIAALTYPTGDGEKSISALLPLLADSIAEFTVGHHSFAPPMGWSVEKQRDGSVMLLSPSKPAYIALSPVEWKEGTTIKARIGSEAMTPREEVQVTAAGQPVTVQVLDSTKGAGAVGVIHAGAGSSVMVVLSAPNPEFDGYMLLFRWWLENQPTLK
jgi:hypothetical protein